MAFHRQPQFARLALHNLHQIAFGGGNARQQLAPKLQQPHPRRREADGRGFALKQRRAEIVFQHANLVRQRGLGQKHTLGCLRHAARFFQSQQGTQMAQFNNAFSHGGMGVGTRKAAFYSGLKAQCYSVGPICTSCKETVLANPKTDAVYCSRA